MFSSSFPAASGSHVGVLVQVFAEHDAESNVIYAGAGVFAQRTHVMHVSERQLNSSLTSCPYPCYVSHNQFVRWDGMRTSTSQSSSWLLGLLLMTSTFKSRMKLARPAQSWSLRLAQTPALTACTARVCLSHRGLLLAVRLSRTIQHACKGP